MHNLEGYEVYGLDRIPAEGALIVYYHGMVPIDAIYISAVFHKFLNQQIVAVIDKTLYRTPGVRIMAEVKTEVELTNLYAIN